LHYFLLADEKYDKCMQRAEDATYFISAELRFIFRPEENPLELD